MEVIVALVNAMHSGRYLGTYFETDYAYGNIHYVEILLKSQR